MKKAVKRTESKRKEKVGGTKSFEDYLNKIEHQDKAKERKQKVNDIDLLEDWNI